MQRRGQIRWIEAEKRKLWNFDGNSPATCGEIGPANTGGCVQQSKVENDACGRDKTSVHGTLRGGPGKGAGFLERM